MRQVTIVTLFVLGCSPPPAAPFQFTERLESRALPMAQTLRPGDGFDPVTLEARGACFNLATLTPTFTSGSSSFVDLEPGPDVEARLRRHLSSLGDDGELVARGTFTDIEAAFSAGAPSVRARFISSWVERTVRLTGCQPTFPTAREFIEQCGAGFVMTEGYRHIGVGLELSPSPDQAALNFVSWGAPAPTTATNDAVQAAFDVRAATANASDLTQDLPTNAGTRRLARLNGRPANTVGWCVTSPVVGASCLERLVTEFGLMRLPSELVTLRESSWRAVQEGPLAAQPSMARLDQARVLQERRAHCLRVELPAAVTRCTAAFSSQDPAVCAQCETPPECDPQRLSDDWEQLGGP